MLPQSDERVQRSHKKGLGRGMAMRAGGPTATSLLAEYRLPEGQQQTHSLQPPRLLCGLRRGLLRKLFFEKRICADPVPAGQGPSELTSPAFSPDTARTHASLRPHLYDLAMPLRLQRLRPLVSHERTYKERNIRIQEEFMTYCHSTRCGFSASFWARAGMGNDGSLKYFRTIGPNSSNTLDAS